MADFWIAPSILSADFARLVKILDDAKYSGYLIFEYEEDEDAYEAIPRYIKQLRQVIKS